MNYQTRYENLLRLDYNFTPKTTVYFRGTRGYERFEGAFISSFSNSSWGQMNTKFYLPTDFFLGGPNPHLLSGSSTNLRSGLAARTRR